MKPPVYLSTSACIHSGKGGKGLRRFLFTSLTIIIATFALASRGDERDKDDKHSIARNVVYLTSNNPEPGKNSVLAYRRNPTTGGLTLLGNFPTKGTGFYNNDERLGPDDSDQEIVASEDRRFLFAVNSGSDTVAVFEINADGSLTHVKGSPFPSGGVRSL